MDVYVDDWVRDAYRKVIGGWPDDEATVRLGKLSQVFRSSAGQDAYRDATQTKLVSREDLERVMATIKDDPAAFDELMGSPRLRSTANRKGSMFGFD